VLKNAITWFIDNPIATNLLMGILVVGGLLSLPNIHKEEFPSVETDVVRVSVVYLGASPIEVEEGICQRVEEKVDGLPGIEKITAIAGEGSCQVLIQVAAAAEFSRVTQDIKNRVDSINTFPAEAEKPQVSQLTVENPVLQVALSGETTERGLKELGKRVRDEIIQLPGVSQVDLLYTRPYEISIEVPKHILTRFDLSLDEVASAVRRSSLNTPGGSVYTDSGEVLVRTDDKRYWGEQYEDIIIRSSAEGAQLYLRDIATINDGFEYNHLSAMFNGKPSVILQVSRVGNEDSITIAEQVKGYVATKGPSLPDGINIEVWRDDSEQLLMRIKALNKNALSGLILVLIILALFLRFKVAAWVAAGIPISILGALMLFPAIPLAISTLSVMAFILVLGILVDDAIVVGERIYYYEERGLSRRESAIKGATEVSVPVIFGVLTTMATFVPMLMVDTTMGRFFAVISGTVLVCLLMSLVESMFVLPSHLANQVSSAARSSTDKSRYRKFQDRFNERVDHFIEGRFTNFLRACLLNRYLTLSISIAVVVISVGLLASGRLVFQFFPAVAGDRIHATLTMQEGVAIEETRRVLDRIERAADALEEEWQLQQSDSSTQVVINRMRLEGDTMYKGDMQPDIASGARSHIAEYGIEVLPGSELDGMTSNEAALRWRELVGAIPEAVELTISADAFGAGDPIMLQMRGADMVNLRAAAAEVKQKLAEFSGVYSVTDSFRAGKQEIKLTLNDSARSLGITLDDLGRQVRSAFYGAQVYRMQRGLDEVKVMVRLPHSERVSISSLETMFIRTPSGIEVPFATVANASYGRGYSSIRRQDRQRIVDVIAQVNRDMVSPEKVLERMQLEELPKILAKYPSVSYSLGGEAEERAKTMGKLGNAFMFAMLVVYALLAVPLKSYTQPFIIMSVIPFGAIGAIVGHAVMNVDLVFFSLLGIIALAGVVVNSSLVLVDYINRLRLQGEEVFEAVVLAGKARFRPIILTSLTTFVGLLPLMSSTDPSTFFMVPMAVSLSYGLLFATLITLALVPSLYLIGDDMNRLKSGAIKALLGKHDNQDPLRPK